jgi:hypothetical protein
VCVFGANKDVNGSVEVLYVIFNHSKLQPFQTSTIPSFNHSKLQPFQTSTIPNFNHSKLQPFQTSTIAQLYT